MQHAHPLTTYRKNHSPVLTKAALAKELGVSRNTVHRWEAGIRKPELDLLSLIVEKTGIPKRELRPDLVEAMSEEKP